MTLLSFVFFPDATPLPSVAEVLPLLLLIGLEWEGQT